jgi:hypothetical protein
MSAKIGLIDVDSHKGFPNLALMKLSAWHKSVGDTVEWYNIFEKYHKVYLSKIFSDTPDYGMVINNADEVVRGGTGYAIHGAGGEHYIKDDDKPLPEEIEHIYPDYDLYGIKDTAYGFLTRGCPRGCAFCIVGKKEGLCSRKVANLSEFWTGQRNIVLCDPNILACREWKECFSQLEESKAYIDLNQGLDARMLTEEKCLAIERLKIKEIHFAWDRYEDKNVVLPKLRLFSEVCSKKPKMHNAIVYVLVNHGSTLEQDLERIYTLRDLGFWAYVMVYDKPHASQTIRDLQRWCNNRFVFGSCPRFEDYGKVRLTDDSRQLELF